MPGSEADALKLAVQKAAQAMKTRPLSEPETEDQAAQNEQSQPRGGLPGAS